MLDAARTRQNRAHERVFLITSSSLVTVPAGFTATVDSAFNGTDSLGRVGTGNDLAVTINVVPEPQSFVLVAIGLCGLLAVRRKRA